MVPLIPGSWFRLERSPSKYRLSGRTNAAIRIWERDPSMGSTTVHCVEVHLEHRMKFSGEPGFYMDEGVERQLQSYVPPHCRMKRGRLLGIT